MNFLACSRYCCSVKVTQVEYSSWGLLAYSTFSSRMEMLKMSSIEMLKFLLIFTKMSFKNFFRNTDGTFYTLYFWNRFMFIKFFFSCFIFICYIIKAVTDQNSLGILIFIWIRRYTSSIYVCVYYTCIYKNCTQSKLKLVDPRMKHMVAIIILFYSQILKKICILLSCNKL